MDVAQVKLKNVHRIELTAIPENSIAVILQYDLEEPAGSILVYRAPDYTSPAELPGPSGVAIIPIKERTIYIQRTKGLKTIRSLEVIGYCDDSRDLDSAEAARKTINEVAKHLANENPTIQILDSYVVVKKTDNGKCQ